MIEARDITIDELEATAAELGISLPIEQTSAWSRYQATIDGRTPWGCVALEEHDADGAAHTVALASLFDYETHGYHYLRTNHAPVWVETPTPEQEAVGIEALAAHVTSATTSRSSSACRSSPTCLPVSPRFPAFPTTTRSSSTSRAATRPSSRA